MSATASKKMTYWYADFKEYEHVSELNRRYWDTHRDLIIERFPARDGYDARRRAFEIAREYLNEPYLGDICEASAWPGREAPFTERMRASRVRSPRSTR